MLFRVERVPASAASSTGQVELVELISPRSHVVSIGSERELVHGLFAGADTSSTLRCPGASAIGACRPTDCTAPWDVLI